MEINLIVCDLDASLEDPDFLIGLFATAALGAFATFVLARLWALKRLAARKVAVTAGITVLLVALRPVPFICLFGSLATHLTADRAARLHFWNVGPFLPYVWVPMLAALAAGIALRFVPRAGESPASR